MTRLLEKSGVLFGLLQSLGLSPSKDERFCSWFDKLTTSGYLASDAKY
jgi:hypothetical protein